ncbi:unnamed protein product [Toxocara canis]|uniref:Pyroglutamyl-peptidase 1 n=1 Tax=Toxocara canis TaxID=6265 RepID=A0A183UT46_TOXCA|nr:unnamed protein product [Toxocara canis]
MACNDRNRPVVVLTGFGPYGSFQDNPSAAVVRRIEDEGATICSMSQGCCIGRSPSYRSDTGQVPCGNTCPCGVETTERPQSVLVSDFDCNEIASSVSQFFDSNCIKIEPSYDPGRYLCAYSYFISLSHDKRKSLFVHVPGFNEDITEQLVATALKRIINECFKQLNRS